MRGPLNGPAVHFLHEALDDGNAPARTRHHQPRCVDLRDLLYVQAFRFRRRGLPHYGLILTVDQLQPAGQQYLRRWATAWLVGLGTSVLAALVL